MNNVKQLTDEGVNADPTVRLAPSELLLVANHVNACVDAGFACVIMACLGGAKDHTDYHFWENEAVSAQSTCNFSATWADSLEKIAAVDPDFALFLQHKKDAVREVADAQEHRQTKQDAENVVKKEAELAKDATQPVVNLAKNSFDLLDALTAHPILTVIGIVAVAALAYGIGQSIIKKG